MDANDLYDQPNSLSLQDDNERLDLLQRIEELEQFEKRARGLLRVWFDWMDTEPSIITLTKWYITGCRISNTTCDLLNE